VRRAPAYAGGWTFRTVLGEQDLTAAVQRANREIVLRLPIEGDIQTLVLERRRS
jgi:hypothetical protein